MQDLIMKISLLLQQKISVTLSKMLTVMEINQFKRTIKKFKLGRFPFLNIVFFSKNGIITYSLCIRLCRRVEGAETPKFA